MRFRPLSLILLPGRFAVCKMAPTAVIPAWAASEAFVSITRTNEELSIVCAELIVPEEVECARGWRCLRVAGTMDFSLVGVLASLVAPLAEAQISVFAISTFDTDYLLLPEKDFALRAGGAPSHRPFDCVTSGMQSRDNSGDLQRTSLLRIVSGKLHWRTVNGPRQAGFAAGCSV